MSDCTATHFASGLTCQQVGKHMDHAVFVDGRWWYWIVDDGPESDPEPDEPKLTAQEALDEALGLAEQGMDPTWGDRAFAAIAGLAMSQPTITGDDVWAWMGRNGVEGPSEPRALGVVFLRAARQGLIAKTSEFRDSVRPECCKRPLRVWASCVFVPKEQPGLASPDVSPVAHDDDVLSARFMRQSGILWRINSEILHPLGLALSVDVRQDANGTLNDNIPAVLRMLIEDEPWEYAPKDDAQGSAQWENFRDERLRLMDQN